MNKKLNIKPFFLNILKISVAASLVIYLISSGKLEFSHLEILYQKPEVSAVIVLGWLLVIVLMGSTRWWILLQGLGLNVAFGRTIQLHLTGLFFNSTMPGAVGGDIIKALYVYREQKAQFKTPAMLTILLDRVVGLIGIFMIGALAVLANFSELWLHPPLRPVLIFILTLFAGSIAFFFIVFLPTKDETDKFLRFFSLPIVGFSFFRKIYAALRAYRHNPFYLIAALLISILIQSIFMFFFIYMTEELGGGPVPFSRFAAVYPIAMLTSALPLAPGGVGVGHVAFDTMYQMIGLKQGANVFNIFVLAQILLNLSGIVPYLLFKRKTYP